MAARIAAKRIEARSCVLAAGGFESNREWVREACGQNEAGEWPTDKYSAMTSGVRWSLIALIAFLIFVLYASYDGGLNWLEEVKLASGDVITVKRTAKTAPFGEIGGSGGWEKKGMTLAIESPKKADNPPTWDFPFVLIVFDRDAKTNEWFVVATFYSCQSWYDLGKPKLPYTEYRLTSGAWNRVALSPDAIGRAANMLTDIHSGGEPKLLTLGNKSQRMSDPRIAKKYVHVVEKWTTTC